MNLDEYVATLSPTHTFYLDDMRATAESNGDALPADFDLLMEVDRRARIDRWFQAHHDTALDYCEPDPDAQEGVVAYVVMLAETQEEMKVFLEDSIHIIIRDNA